jgi:hypothetical protein
LRITANSRKQNNGNDGTDTFSLQHLPKALTTFSIQAARHQATDEEKALFVEQQKFGCPLRGWQLFADVPKPRMHEVRAQNSKTGTHAPKQHRWLETSLNGKSQNSDLTLHGRSDVLHSSLLGRTRAWTWRLCETLEETQ